MIELTIPDYALGALDACWVGALILGCGFFVLMLLFVPWREYGYKFRKWCEWTWRELCQKLEIARKLARARRNNGL